MLKISGLAATPREVVLAVPAESADICAVVNLWLIFVSLLHFHEQTCETMFSLRQADVSRSTFVKMLALAVAGS